MRAQFIFAFDDQSPALYPGKALPTKKDTLDDQLGSAWWRVDMCTCEGETIPDPDDDSQEISPAWGARISWLRAAIAELVATDNQDDQDMLEYIHTICWVKDLARTAFILQRAKAINAMLYPAIREQIRKEYLAKHEREDDDPDPDGRFGGEFDIGMESGASFDMMFARIRDSIDVGFRTMVTDYQIDHAGESFWDETRLWWANNWTAEDQLLLFARCHLILSGLWDPQVKESETGGLDGVEVDFIDDTEVAPTDANFPQRPIFQLPHDWKNIREWLDAFDNSTSVNFADSEEWPPGWSYDEETGKWSAPAGWYEAGYMTRDGKEVEMKWRRVPQNYAHIEEWRLWAASGIPGPGTAPVGWNSEGGPWRAPGWHCGADW
ncbi:hypothetical protein DAPPUDRAFT_124277, partial [Daphnia pulex]